MVRISSVSTTFLLVLSSLFIAYCQSTPDAKPEPAKADRRYSISCDGGPVVIKIDSKGNPAEKGKVDLGAMSCDAASKLDDRGLIKLKRVGTWEFFAESVKIRTEEYVAGKKEGAEVGYFADGSEKYTGRNANDKKTGHWKQKSAIDSDCYTEGDFADDLKTGPWKECKEAEKKKFYLEFEGNYVQGLKDGPAVSYYPDGSKSAEGSFRADTACRAQAVAKVPPRKEEIEACGKRINRWTYYHANGQKSTEGDYDPATGKEMGTWIENYATGAKLGMGARDGDRNGLWTFYDKNGSIVYQLNFVKSEFIPSGGVIWKDGKKAGEGSFAMGLFKYDAGADQIVATGLIKDGKWTEYYPNGQKSGEGSYQGNRKDGRWTFYDESGKKTSEGNLLMEKKDGVWTELVNGNYVTRTYMFGRLQGK